MSIFDYPRINFSGYIAMDPGTANNDDYAQGGGVTLPKSYGKYAGEVLGLIDSINVEPRTYGMSDEDFIAWAQKAQQFDGYPDPIIPAEWNYYGPQTMGINGKEVHGNKMAASIIGVQTGPGQDQLFSSPDGALPITDLIGEGLTLSGHLTDINSEGSPPATQFFVDQIAIGGGEAITGFSKGVGIWLNFYRNINLQQDGGAGAYVYHVVPKDKIGPLSGYFNAPDVQGLIFRYYLYRPQLKGTNKELQNTIYPAHAQNPAPLQISGTIAPWKVGEDITTMPVGRLLTMTEVSLCTPTKNNNGGGKIALAPAVLRVLGNLISVDFSGTFPDNFVDMHSNPKFDFGGVSLWASDGKNSLKIADVQYEDADVGNARGWVFDYPKPKGKVAVKMLHPTNLANVKFSLRWNGQTLMEETDYYFVTNQLAVYGEQGGSSTDFVNQGTKEQITLSVYSRGAKLSPDQCPPIHVWEYRTNPIQSPGNAHKISSDLKPGQVLSADTSEPGNYLFTFAIDPPKGFPPENYNGFMNPPFTTMTNSPMISLRLLPNTVDFSPYYDDVSDPENTGNDKLTWPVVYQHALRPYYLLYPAMNYQAFQLNDCAAVSAAWQGILQVTDPKNWMSISYMPRTRDLSDSRRTLLRAWCRKVGKMKAEGIDPCPQAEEG